MFTSNGPNQSKTVIKTCFLCNEKFVCKKVLIFRPSSKTYVWFKIFSCAPLTENYIHDCNGPVSITRLPNMGVGGVWKISLKTFQTKATPLNIHIAYISVIMHHFQNLFSKNDFNTSQYSQVGPMSESNSILECNL